MTQLNLPVPASARARHRLGVSWPLLVGALALLCVVGLSGSVLGDPDTYWHLTAGRWIIDHRGLPVHDPFSHTMPGSVWVAHEWGSEVLMAWLFGWAGWSGLALLVASSFALTLAFLARFLLERMEPVHALLLVVLAGAMMTSHLLARPHVLVWPLLALWMGTLVRAAESREAPPWWLLGVLVAWANLHLSFTLALALGVFVGLDAVAQEATWAARQRTARLWSAFLVAAGAAVLLNPQGWHAVVFPIHIMQMKLLLAGILEWQSPNFHEPQILALWLLVMLGLAFSGRLRLPLVRAGTLLFLLYLALKHQRYIGQLGLLSAFLVATPLARQWHDRRSTGKDAEGVDRFFRALAAPAEPGGMLTVALVTAVAAFSMLRGNAPAPPAASTPQAALQAALATGVRGPVLNGYNFGGYLIYSGIPVFIDGRSEMYGERYFVDYVDALNLKEDRGLERLLSKYAIAWTLLNAEAPAVRLLDRLPGWQRIYADKTAVVHIRRDATPAR